MKRVRIVGVISISIAIVLSVTVAIIRIRQDATSTPTSSDTQVVTHSTTNPDESKPNAQAYQWRGAAGEPKTLRVPKLGIETFIQNLGVDQNKQVATPNNVHLAGWYNQSVKPGEAGLSVVVGHVTGVRSDGVFKNLSTLDVGDEIEVVKGDGSTVTYTVFATRRVREADAAAALFSQEPRLTSQLNLITCAGTFDKQANAYPDRFIAQATLR